jgi:hypothetical protein
MIFNLGGTWAPSEELLKILMFRLYSRQIKPESLENGLKYED